MTLEAIREKVTRRDRLSFDDGLEAMRRTLRRGATPAVVRLHDSTEAARAIRALGRIVSQQLPVLPLMYGVAWAEFSTRHASGWPNGQDAYEPATPTAPFAEYTVLQLGPPST